MAATVLALPLPFQAWAAEESSSSVPEAVTDTISGAGDYAADYVGTVHPSILSVSLPSVIPIWVSQPVPVRMGRNSLNQETGYEFYQQPTERHLALNPTSDDLTVTNSSSRTLKLTVVRLETAPEGTVTAWPGYADADGVQSEVSEPKWSDGTEVSWKDGDADKGAVKDAEYGGVTLVNSKEALKTPKSVAIALKTEGALGQNPAESIYGSALLADSADVPVAEIAPGESERLYVYCLASARYEKGVLEAYNFAVAPVVKVEFVEAGA